MRILRALLPLCAALGLALPGSHAVLAQMPTVKDVDLAAFRKAGEKAYEVLKINDAKVAVHREIGK